MIRMQRPASQPADELLAPLLANDDITGPLAFLEELLVLHLSVELEEHPELRPGEVDARQYPPRWIGDLVLRFGHREPIDVAEIERAGFTHGLDLRVRQSEHQVGDQRVRPLRHGAVPVSESLECRVFNVQQVVDDDEAVLDIGNCRDLEPEPGGAHHRNAVADDHVVRFDRPRVLPNAGLLTSDLAVESGDVYLVHGRGPRSVRRTPAVPSTCDRTASTFACCRTARARTEC